jgi:hypothetical protein
MLCKTCDLKPTCTSLCPEAEAYASQDEVPPRNRPDRAQIVYENEWSRDVRLRIDNLLHAWYHRDM